MLGDKIITIKPQLTKVTDSGSRNSIYAIPLKRRVLLQVIKRTSRTYNRNYIYINKYTDDKNKKYKNTKNNKLNIITYAAIRI